LIPYPPDTPDCARRYDRCFQSQEEKESLYFTVPTCVVKQWTSCVVEFWVIF
jgi:hypothetical protein